MNAVRSVYKYTGALWEEVTAESRLQREFANDVDDRRRACQVLWIWFSTIAIHMRAIEARLPNASRATGDLFSLSKGSTSVTLLLRDC